MELIESGDYDRAIVELRNVFEFDAGHREARFTLANTLLNQKDDVGGAYSQFLRLVEQYPEDVEARIILSELAFRAINWEEVERHGTVAQELAPDNPRVQAIAIALAYRTAILEEDTPAQREQGRAAEALLNTLPESIMLRSIAMNTHLSDGDFTQALEDIDWLLERRPDNVIYWRQRLSILAQLDDLEGVEAQLLDMVERFPEDIANAQAVLNFYLSRGETDKAEAFLRGLVAKADAGDVQLRADLVNFLLQTRGPDAAQAELEAAIADAPDPTMFLVLKAGLDFQEGSPDAAIASLEGILESAEPSAETRDIKVTLARMLLATGNEVGARARIEDVLAEDDSHPEALKMQAAWQIQADAADEAVNSLRLALDRAPEDAQAMTLMAQAYQRSGRPELARDFLALAVDASGNAPEETLRYANLLIEEERFIPAEDILLPALRLAPQNIDLLNAMGRLYIAMEDVGRAQQVIDTLRDLETEAGEQLANQFRAQVIAQQSGVDEAVTYLESVAQSTDASISSQVDLIRARLAQGDTDEALRIARELSTDNPDNLSIKAITATVESAAGNFSTAIDIYREILSAEPRAANMWVSLARATQLQQGGNAGEAIIEEALAALPGNPDLLWASASYKQRNGDIDGAIEIYEGLYAENSGSVIVANNLASLLSTYRTDEASLERAWTVARRFRDTDIPAMQDTFGWILHRRGETEDALPYLEAAARGLPNDPLVQFHLGQAYQTLNRPEDALAQYRLAVQIAGPDDTSAQIEEARNQIAAAEN